MIIREDLKEDNFFIDVPMSPLSFDSDRPIES